MARKSAALVQRVLLGRCLSQVTIDSKYMLAAPSKSNLSDTAEVRKSPLAERGLNQRTTKSKRDLALRAQIVSERKGQMGCFSAGFEGMALRPMGRLFRIGDVASSASRSVNWPRGPCLSLAPCISGSNS